MLQLLARKSMAGLQFARRVKVIPPESPYFAVSASTAGSKVAAGMEVTITVTFSPDSESDFLWDLVVCTEREKFIVPILARGARGALDLPDLVDFGAACPCRVVARKSFLVRNTGRRETRFALAAAAPFTVAPRSGFLAVGESLQFAVSFTPERVGVDESDLEVTFDSGDVARVRMVGRGVDIDVGVVPQSVTFLKTFVTKMAQRTFTLVNNSTTPAAFALKRFATADEERGAARAEAAAMLAQCPYPVADAVATGGAPDSPHGKRASFALESGAAADFAAAVEGAVGDAEAVAAQQRRYRKLLTQTMAQRYLFQSGAVAAFPLEGVVYPNSTVEVRTRRSAPRVLCDMVLRAAGSPAASALHVYRLAAVTR